ncbi:UDP-2,4-diacetamido-2,4,6-trideoxy-beta-L-altropyranose hydrolase [Oscillospiraceae bacterium MB08-C2-2]|nr:UDP-2,4-diacetamido-2,4,6-trideoxy-beta-L-altropyranose hydrolase [Oscillospiraceae bacterium MB08-C2-2]
MLYIRADGNAKIGTGHIMRCMSIAVAARRLGGDCTFITADREMEPLLTQRGFSVICLESAWDDLEQESEKMQALIRERGIKTLLVDSYFAAEAYLAHLKTLTCTAYMDDLDEHPYPCHILINYNRYGEELGYDARYPHTKLLLGSRYAPLREEFSGLPAKGTAQTPRSVLVTTGGSDPYNVAGKVVEAAKAHPLLGGLIFHIVAGRFNAHLPQLLELEKNTPGVKVHTGVEKMEPLMSGCDLAVSAAGSTLYELCACGVPTVLFVMADNQIKGAQALAQKEMLFGGDVRSQESQWLGAIIEGLEKLAGDAALRRRLSQNAQRLVDGRGAERIAHTLLSF